VTASENNYSSNGREDFKRKRGFQTEERIETKERTSNERKDFKRRRGLQTKERISNQRKDFKRKKGP